MVRVAAQVLVRARRDVLREQAHVVADARGLRHTSEAHDARTAVLWEIPDFRESFFEICGMVAKGRKSTKVAGEARASGYNIVRASKIVRFQAPKSPFPWKIVCCTHQETRPPAKLPKTVELSC